MVWGCILWHTSLRLRNAKKKSTDDMCHSFANDEKKNKKQVYGTNSSCNHDVGLSCLYSYDLLYHNPNIDSYNRYLI